MNHGADWYKREPLAFLGGVQGMTAKQIAVYTVVLELIYAHGGSVNNDARWIAGWVQDMGAAAVRRAISDLVEMGKLSIEEDGSLTQKRAKSEAKTRENLRETARKNGKKGGENSAKSREERRENNNLGEAAASYETQADKIREEKISDANASDGDAVVDIAKHLFENGVRFLCRHGIPERQARAVIGRWRKAHQDGEILEAFRECHRQGVVSPIPWIEARFKPKDREYANEAERIADIRARLRAREA